MFRHRFVSVRVFALSLFLLVAAGASAEELGIRDAPDQDIWIVSSREDGSVPADCSFAPFTPHAAVGAGFYSIKTRRAYGSTKVIQDERVGSGVACLFFNDFRFAPGSTVRLYGLIVLDGVGHLLDGTCTIVSNTVPVPRLLLSSCALTYVVPPPGYVGGLATSNSVFNPFRVEGFNTSSVWTLRLFREPQ